MRSECEETVKGLNASSAAEEGCSNCLQVGQQTEKVHLKVKWSGKRETHETKGEEKCLFVALCPPLMEC